MIKILTFFTTVAIAVTSWFLNQTLTKIDSLDHRVYAIEFNRAKDTSNNFTNRDWQDAKSVIDNEKFLTEKRIIILEQSIPQIKESLIRIEKSIERNNGQASN